MSTTSIWPWVMVAGLVLVGCGKADDPMQTATVSSDDGGGGGSSTSGSPVTTTIDPSDTTLMTTATTGGTESSGDDSSTGPSEPAEYEGFYGSAFGFVHIEACGESDYWAVEGLPSYEMCAEAPLYVRVLGVLGPPYEGGTAPVLNVLEVLEGPCRGGSCDGSVPVGECASFDELCARYFDFKCSILWQDCPMGEKCMPWANDGGMEWNATRCVPLSPMLGGPGDPCLVEGLPTSGIDDCEVGAMCWNVDPDTLQGECATLCNKFGPVCPEGTTCIPFFKGDEPEPVGVCVVRL